ncbi:MAG TPA: hypothetical protein DCL63_08115 [Firmicutes bacterium]|nr:hypothetical protein [Bacillota bacterium]HBK60519.1 hypothetical protein [Bacillota bacterium]
MALCLAASLVEQGGFDPVAQLERYLRCDTAQKESGFLRRMIQPVAQSDISSR